MSNLFPSLLLIVFGFAVYFNVLNSPFYMDDFGQIVRNDKINDLGNIPSLFFQSNHFRGDETSAFGYIYKPVFYTTNTLIYVLGNGSPLAFHLLQISVFGVNSVLLFLFFRKFFKRKLSFMLALVFLVHPANEEVAQYIAATQDVLFFFFGMTALCLVTTKYAAKIKTVIICSVLVLISCLSKETGILFLMLILVYNYLFQNKLFRLYVYFLFFAGLIYLALRFIAFNNPTTLAIKSEHMAFLSERLVIVPKVIFYYIEQIVTPTYSIPDLAYLENPEIKSAIFPLLISVLILTLLAIVGFWIRRYFKSSFRSYLFFLIWFLAGIFLHSQIIPLDVVIASRWIYFPIAGALGMLGVLISILTPYFLKYRILLLVLYFVYLGMCIYVTERLNIHRSKFNSYSQQF